jgi:putative chitinase
MTDPRIPVFEAVRAITAPGLFNDAGNLHALHNLLDAFGARREDPAIVPLRTRLTNAPAFFAFLRAGKYLGPALSEMEVQGCEAILAACGEAGWPIADTAYALATAWWETAHTMQPVKELGGPTYYRRMYDIEGARPAKARELGNLTPGDGVNYCGRGYPQLTGLKNYQKADTKLRALGILKPGESLVDNPDLAMRPDIAAAIMIYGMREGWFTARDLDDDLPRQGEASLQQFIASRDIINGTDKAAPIAEAAIHFQGGLRAGAWA